MKILRASVLAAVACLMSSVAYPAERLSEIRIGIVSRAGVCASAVGQLRVVINARKHNFIDRGVAHLALICV